MKKNNRQFYILLIILAVAVNFTGINLRFFTDDPALYASIAKNMVYRKDFLQLFTYNQDWLDKPHFPFWLVYGSFKLFGICESAYRLPALLFFLLSLLYTYLFSKKYYGTETALIAVLISATALNTLMCNTDVRAEPYLMALVTGSIYHISQLYDRYKFSDLFMAALLTACAIMTKGLFVIIPIYGGLFFHALFRRQFKNLFSFKWLFLGLLTAIFILPECYALYVQFDAHPGKILFGRENISGIKWFLWDSQFGRFVNNGPITRKSSDIFFFVHTLLWAFAPWCLLFYFSLYKNIRELFAKRKLTEYYALFGGLLLLILFSLSRFQLPFYTNTIFPLFAIVTAPFVYGQLSKIEDNFRTISQWVYIILLFLIVLLIDYLSRPDHQAIFIVDAILFALLFAFILLKIGKSPQRLFMLSSAVMLFVNLFLNTSFYDVLITNKGQITAAKYIDQQQFSGYHIYSLKTENNIFQFYCNRPVDFLPIDQFNTFKTTDSAVFYANQASMDTLKNRKVNFRVMKTFADYPQENLLPAFVNASTRYKVMGQVYLIEK